MVRIPSREGGPKAALAGRRPGRNGITTSLLLLILLAALAGLAVPADARHHATIAAGANHSLGIKADGTLAAWGYNSYRQSTVPPALTDVKEVSAGVFHNLALRSDGTVTAWGNNLYGESAVPS